MWSFFGFLNRCPHESFAACTSTQDGLPHGLQELLRVKGLGSSQPEPASLQDDNVPSLYVRRL